LLGFGWLALTPFAIKYLKESKKETKKEVRFGDKLKRLYTTPLIILGVAG
jgi:hypothetical protein